MDGAYGSYDISSRRRYSLTGGEGAAREPTWALDEHLASLATLYGVRPGVQPDLMEPLEAFGAPCLCQMGACEGCGKWLYSVVEPMRRGPAKGWFCGRCRPLGTGDGSGRVDHAEWVARRRGTK